MLIGMYACKSWPLHRAKHSSNHSSLHMNTNTGGKAAAGDYLIYQRDSNKHQERHYLIQVELLLVKTMSTVAATRSNNLAMSGYKV